MVIEADSWPLPRRRRTGPPSSLATIAETTGEDEFSVPRFRFFSAIINEVATSRKSVSTPRLIGPAVITQCDFQYGSASDPPTGSLEIGWSLTAVTENAVALTTPRPYTILTEKIDPFNVSDAQSGSGILNKVLNNPRGKFIRPLRFLVTEPAFVFVFALVNNSGLAENIFLEAAILEAMPPSLVNQYMMQG